MQRSKQQALMFLLGAVLVGGVVGASAIKVMDKKPSRPSPRVQMYDDIGLDSAQRFKVDSILDETNCKTADFMRQFRPSMDSIRAEGRAVIFGVMSKEQRAAYEAREKRMRAAMDSADRHRDSIWTREHPGVDRPRRCGGPPRGPGGSSGDRGGPRPFL